MGSVVRIAYGKSKNISFRQNLEFYGLLNQMHFKSNKYEIILFQLIKLPLISDLPAYNIKYGNLMEMLIWEYNKTKQYLL